MSGAKVVFEMRGPRVKLIVHHPVEPWIGIITLSNVFELWDYQSKILLKSFNCITLDDMKNIDIKDIIFFDKSTTKPLNTYQRDNIPNKKTTRSWVIFTTQRKLFFYDYMTDITRNITEKELDSKVIRKIEQVSDSTICVGTADGTLKIVDVHQFVPIKTFKNYYSKPITWIISYKQNQYERPRVIAASQDSTMACWNVDSNLETPSFRFLMKKKSALDNTSNDGQEIISMKYQRSTFRLLTLTEQYVTVWSTFSGHELRRLKNIHGLKDIQFFSQQNYPVDSFLSHSKGEDIFISTVMLDIKHTGGSITNFDAHNLINLKGIFNDNGNTKLIGITILPPQPWVLCLNTTSGIFLLEVNRVIIDTVCFSDLFTTKLTITNSKQFFVDQVLNQAAITPNRLLSMNFKQTEYFNFFYLTNQRNFINLKLVELKISDMSYMTSQFNLMDLYFNPLLNERLLIKVSFDGRLLALLSPVTSYVQVYMVDIQKGLHSVPGSERIDFYSKFRRVFSGMCADFEWHQYKNQFCIIAPTNSKGQFITYKKGNKGMEPDGKTQGFQFVIYHLKNESFQIFFKKSVQTKIKRCFSGLFFGCSVKQSAVEPDQPLTKQQERIQFIQTCEGTVKVFDPFLHVPEKIYWNYCGTVMIACYDTYFIIYKVGQDGLIGYLRKIQKSLVNGYFWEKLFFFVTASTVQYLQILNNEIIEIVIATNQSKFEDPLAPQFDIFNPLYLDTLDCPPLQKPLGQLRILNITNLHLCMIDQVGSICFLNLSGNPYIVFVMEIISGSFKDSKFIYEHCDDKTLPILDEIIKQYGILHTDFLSK